MSRKVFVIEMESVDGNQFMNLKRPRLKKHDWHYNFRKGNKCVNCGTYKRDIDGAYKRNCKG